MRVGAAQGMLVAGFDVLAIMQAGGGKTTAVLLRYVENASTRALHEKRGNLSGRYRQGLVRFEGSVLSGLLARDFARLAG